MTWDAVKTDRVAPSVGPFSVAVRTGETVYTSGQIALNAASGALVGADVQEQTRQAFRNLEAVLDAAGKSLKDVVKTTVFLADMSKFGEMNEVYASYFEAPYPARTTIQAAGLPLGALVEIEAIAQ